MDAAKVAICIVTHNSEEDLRDCLESVDALRFRAIELVIVDCASSDSSVAAVTENHPPDIPLVHRVLSDNIGFAGGMNEALAQTQAPWVLTSTRMLDRTPTT